MSDELVSVYVTCPTMESARAIATDVVEKGLAGCANMVQAQSVYRWKGATVEEAEVVMFLKTTRGAVAMLMEAIAARHPHDVPCIVVLPILETAASYGDWLRAQVPES